MNINHLNFHSIDLSAEEGGGTVELVAGGRDLTVTPHNVYDYVRKYAEYRMIKSQEKALEGLKTGVFDVLPSGSLDGLTAEDIRLLLNGVGDINVAVLISYTSFNDESGESSERLVKFKRWLWSIVDKMTHIERQDLVSILNFEKFLMRERYQIKILKFFCLGVFLDWKPCFTC